MGQLGTADEFVFRFHARKPGTITTPEGDVAGSIEIEWFRRRHPWARTPSRCTVRENDGCVAWTMQDDARIGRFYCQILVEDADGTELGTVTSVSRSWFSARLHARFEIVVDGATVAFTEPDWKGRIEVRAIDTNVVLAEIAGTRTKSLRYVQPMPDHVRKVIGAVPYAYLSEEKWGMGSGA